MAAAGKKKSKKGVTLSLNEFNNLASAGGDWADLEDDEEEHHHAQSSEKSSSNDNYSRRDNSDRYNEDRGYERRSYNRDDGQERRTNDYGRNKIDAPQKPIPTRGPWMCFAGNLAFDVEENDLKEFFSEYCKVERVRLIVDHETGRTKGYGYVVFEDRESLVTALSANGESVKGRPMRVDVAEPQSDREPRQRRDYDAEPSRADSAEKWERGKALPQKEREYSRRDNDREGGYNRDREGGYNRGYNREGGYNRDRPERRDAPAERKPLVLKAPSNRSSDAVGQAPASSKPSPFGEAKPRDETEYQKRVAQEKEEREKAAAEAAANKAAGGDEANASSPTTDNKPSEKRGNYNSEKKPYEKREYKPAEKREYNDRKPRDNQTERKPNSKYGSQEKDEKNWRDRSGDRREQQSKGNYSYNTQSNTNKVKKEKKGPKFTTVAVKQQDKRVEVKNSFGSLSLNEDA